MVDPEKDSSSKKVKIDPVSYLRSLPAIRERCKLIYQAARDNRLNNFTLHEEALPDVVNYVHAVIHDRFSSDVNAIPNHSRYRHFEPGGVDRLAQLRADLGSNVSQREVARRLVDLVMVSVLLDAGAGNDWRYRESSNGQSFTRSEGLGVASFHMFSAGTFSSATGNPYQVDSRALRNLSVSAIREGFQVDDTSNPMVGVQGRADLLRHLGSALEQYPQYFSAALHDAHQDGGVGKQQQDPHGCIRPGYLVDYLLAKAHRDNEVSIHDLWHLLVTALESMWPAGRTTIDGHNMGDVWPHPALPRSEADASSGNVPFHKLTQWLTYSLLEPLGEAGIRLTDTKAMTGLPEYRNGGLFVDLGVLRLRDAGDKNRAHEAGSELVVEWRALTVVLLDETARLLRHKLGASESQFPLVKVLEGGTWAAGRKVAREKRPETGGPPIEIVSDGTVF